MSASQEVRWKMAEMKRSIAELTENAELYEKQFTHASLQAQEVSRIMGSIKVNKPVSALLATTDYTGSTSSLDMSSSDTGSICSSDTINLSDVVDDKPAVRLTTKRGNERLRSRRKSQYDVNLA